MRIAVEPGACLNTGVCASLALGHFALGSDGEMHVISTDVSPADFVAVAMAVQECPTAAISLRPADTDRTY